MPRNLAYQDDILEEYDHDVYYRPEEEDYDPLTEFLEDGTLTEVIGEIKSGKEGTVFCCRPHPRFGVDLVAAKLFRPRETRTFRDQSLYREGFVIMNGGDRRALKKKSAWGRKVEDSTWMAHEYETLKLLSRAGADVPKPIRLSERVLLMEYIGDEDEAAPKLQEARVSSDEAEPLFERVMRNIELFLAHELVHADLSPYNILYWNGGVSIIDFPQAVDPRKNRNAFDLLHRDIQNVVAYFRRCGVKADANQIARNLWTRYTRALL